VPAISRTLAFVAGAEDLELVEKLKRRDESAFAELVDRYGGTLLRVARMYVSSDAVAQEVVQETWLGVLKGIDRFEGRSSLKTWIFRILTNIARTRGLRESRSVPFSSAANPGEEASVASDRFLSAGHEQAGAWASAPMRWTTPEERLLAGETHGVILEAIERLPSSQREVITLRDVEGWSSQEVCNALEITETNQRVLLHRARSKVREAIERHLNATEQAQ
jgi:RNA polymerase sigma-70 factor (ECF subfamily)